MQWPYLVPSFPYYKVGAFQAEENRISPSSPRLPISHQVKVRFQFSKPPDGFLECSALCPHVLRNRPGIPGSMDNYPQYSITPLVK